MSNDTAVSGFVSKFKKTIINKKENNGFVEGLGIKIGYG
jgi:hypothetical protein